MSRSSTRTFPASAARQPSGPTSLRTMCTSRGVAMDWRVAVAVAAVAAGASGGCKTVECGTGTVEQDDVCIAPGQDPSVDCGPGTVYNKDTARCENSLFADGGGLCGPNTTLV